MPLKKHPNARFDRRAWGKECPKCHRGTGKDENGNADWGYLLAIGGNQLWLQCRYDDCFHDWQFDTHFGVCDRPPHSNDLPDWPEPGSAKL